MRGGKGERRRGGEEARRRGGDAKRGQERREERRRGGEARQREAAEARRGEANGRESEKGEARRDAGRGQERAREARRRQERPGPKIVDFLLVLKGVLQNSSSRWGGVVKRKKWRSRSRGVAEMARATSARQRGAHFWSDFAPHARRESLFSVQLGRGTLGHRSLPLRHARTPQRQALFGE